jgi:4-hydroxybenzoate polyprenyltransferase
MTGFSQSFIKWIGTLNSVDVPGENSFHRFVLSARLGLWPAIVLSSFAYYPLVSTAMLSVNLCLVASFAFLFNDTRDVAIDEFNKVHRWSIRTKFDALLFICAIVLNVLATATGAFWLSKVAFIGLMATIAVSVTYSLFCKKVFLLGNVVAAALSVSPGLIMFIDVRIQGQTGGFVDPALFFLASAMLLLISREIKFDEFDLEGDRIGKRVTVPMILNGIALSALHIFVGMMALSLLLATITFAGKYSQYANLMIALITALLTGTLMLVAYRTASKERFYKMTRLVMLVIPISILVSF